jgi:peptidase E
MAKKQVKKYSIFLVIKEMQIKTTLRFHLTPIRIATIKNTTTIVDEDMRKKEPSYIAGGNVKLLQPLWKTKWRLLKN